MLASDECTESAEVIAGQMAWAIAIDAGGSNERYEEALLIEITRALAPSEEDAERELLEKLCKHMAGKIGVDGYRHYTIELWNGQARAPKHTEE